MLDFDDAQQRLMGAAIPPSTTERVHLADALGRVLAHDLVALIDIPPADNSAMDGYALRFADYDAERTLPVQPAAYAGDVPEALKPGHAMRLFTGSLIPDDADTVVIQEECELDDKQALRILNPPTKGQHVRYQGEDMAQGRTILYAGTLLSSGHVAMLAAQGMAELEVFPKPKIGILTTGNELVAPGTPLKEGQIYTSNAPMLAALVEQMQAVVHRSVQAQDELPAIQEALQQLTQECDLVLTVGGVSVGDKDLVKPAIEAAGGSMNLWRVKMKPGKPVALAHLNDTPIVGLPGNPVSAYAVFILMVSPLLRALQGRTELCPPIHHFPLGGEQRFLGWREDFLRTRLQANATGQLEAVPHSQQFSNIINSLGWASGLARIPADVDTGPGDQVAFYDFNLWAY